MRVYASRDCVCATQDLDAINEPYRPIPSGRITEEEVFQQVYFLLFGGLALAFGCDVWAGHNIIANPLNSVGLLACFGALVSYLYSAPPYKLKAEGWRGSFALGASYIALPWWCGQAMFGHVGEGAAGGELTPPVVVLTVLYSLAGLGIAIVNDFKSIEGADSASSLTFNVIWWRRWRRHDRVRVYAMASSGDHAASTASTRPHESLRVSRGSRGGVATVSVQHRSSRTRTSRSISIGRRPLM